MKCEICSGDHLTKDHNIATVSARYMRNGKRSNAITDRTQLCKEFTELTGGHWHEFPRAQQYKDYFGNICNTNRGRRCACGVSFNSRYKSPNPTYENPADVLRKIIEIGLYDEFIVEHGAVSKYGKHLDSILVDLIIEPDALLKAAVVFLKEGNNG